MDKRQEIFDKVSFVTGYMLYLLSKCEGNPQYKFSLAKTGRQFEKQLEKFESMNVLLRDNLNESQEDLHDNYLAVENIINCAYNLKNENQRKYFNEELEKLVKKYNLVNN